MLITTEDEARREELWVLASQLAFDWYLSVSPTMNYEKSKDPLYDLVTMIESLLNDVQLKGGHGEGRQSNPVGF